MKMTMSRSTRMALFGTGAAVLILCAAGCQHAAPTPLPPGVTPVDSNKPPPNMQALYQRSMAAKAGGNPPTTNTTGQ